MANKRGWIGFDLDGTLAHYDHWRGIDHIGDPIPKMVDLVKKYLAAGYNVKICTARVSEGQEAIIHIQRWCQDHIGRSLEVTNRKDMGMLLLYDDRVKQVVRNKGILVEDLVKKSR